MVTTPAHLPATTPYLAPIERPKGLVLRLLYRILRRQFGILPGWLTVFSARMPLAYTTWMGKVYRLTKKLTVSPELAILVREQVNRINGCTNCMDAGRWYVTTKVPHLLPKLDALHEYATSALYDDGERAALDFASELTEQRHVAPETFAALNHCYSERQICEVVWLVSTANLFNINNRGLGIGSDGLCALAADHAQPRPRAA